MSDLDTPVVVPCWSCAGSGEKEWSDWAEDHTEDCQQCDGLGEVLR
jgi:DnaJ-class molecular chaperone